MLKYFKDLLNTLIEIRDLLKAVDNRLENIETIALSNEERYRANSGY